MISYTLVKKHTALFYNSKEDLFDILIPYFRTGLESNEFCIWATWELLSTEEARGALSKGVENLDYYIKKGQLEIGDYRDYYFRGGKFTSFETLNYWEERKSEIVKKDFGGMRVAGDGTWGVGDDLWLNLNHYEEKINEAIGESNVTAICSYYIPRLGVDKIKSLGLHHQASLVKQMGEWRSLQPSYFANI